MPSVLLLHTNSEYATSLAETVETVAPAYEVTVVSREPISTRLSHLLLGGYDLVQTDELLANGVLSALTSLGTRTPLVTSVRGWADYTNAHGEYGRFRNATIRLRTELALRRSKAVIYLSERTREEFEEYYSVDGGVVIGRPIDIPYYRSGTAKVTDSSEFGLLTVTNLRYEEKFEGVKEVLTGLVPVFDRHEDLRYVVAGGGRYLENLEGFLETYPHAEKVEVLGYREDIPDILAEADAFIYVSYLDAYPTVVLEAQAAGLPVIGGESVGVPAVVGDAGLICQPAADSIGDAVERVVSDDVYRDELAAKSDEKMESYNEETARRHVSVWQRVLDHS